MKSRVIRSEKVDALVAEFCITAAQAYAIRTGLGPAPETVAAAQAQTETVLDWIDSHVPSADAIEAAVAAAALPQFEPSKASQQRALKRRRRR